MGPAEWIDWDGLHGLDGGVSVWIIGLWARTEWAFGEEVG